jgi:uncharacterized protein YycO
MQTVFLNVCLFLGLVLSFCGGVTAADRGINPLRLAPPIVGEYWELEGRAGNFMSRTVKWFAAYKESGGLITPVMLEEMQALGAEFYAIDAEVDKLRADLSKNVNEYLQQNVFDELYEEQMVARGREAFEALMLASTDMIVFEILSFVYNAASVDKNLIKSLDAITIDGRKGHFSRTVDNWLNSTRKKQFARTLEFIDKNAVVLDRLEQEGALFVQALRHRIDTYMADEIKKAGSLWYRIKDFFTKGFISYKNNRSKRFNWMEYRLSKIFGNAVGAINWQKYIECIPEDELERVKHEVLLPGDILLEKTEGAITDTFIPGHFGHVAVYVGRPDQLTNLRFQDGSFFLDHPVVQKYLPLLEKGFTTAEAVRPGFRLEDIREWPVNDLAVLRATSYPQELMAEVLLKTLNYVGTKYDFNFDVNTVDIVVCSELPYQVYKGINFRTNKAAGRFTISPDDVAVAAGPAGVDTVNRPLQLIYFNHKMEPIPESQAFELYRSLLLKEGRYEEVPENNHDYSQLLR